MSTEEPEKREADRKPTRWIVLCGVLAIAAVGLAVWAFSAQSDADDAQAQLEAQAQAASAEVAPEAQEKFDQVADELGAAGDSLDDVEQELDQAWAQLENAEQARTDAGGAIDAAKAEAEAYKAQFELTQACLRGTLDAIGSAYEGGGLEAAAQELQELAGSCRSAAS